MIHHQTHIMPVVETGIYERKFILKVAEYQLEKLLNMCVSPLTPWREVIRRPRLCRLDNKYCVWPFKQKMQLECSTAADTHINQTLSCACLTFTGLDLAVLCLS